MKRLGFLVFLLLNNAFLEPDKIDAEYISQDNNRHLNHRHCQRQPHDTSCNACVYPVSETGQSFTQVGDAGGASQEQHNRQKHKQAGKPCDDHQDISDKLQHP